MTVKRETVRKHFRFYGEVQAVGFRYTAQRAANNFGATGWVKNEYDQSVSMEIQGTNAQINGVINALENDRYIIIDRMESKTLDVIPNEQGFRVQY